MIDAIQLGAWFLVALFFVFVGGVLSRSDAEVMAERWERFAAWMSDHGQPEADEDELFERAELRRVMREDQLQADLARLRHLVATDDYMSATRQIGNRIAYQQVLVEVGALALQPPTVAPDRSWAIERADLGTTRRAAGPETLDIRWR